METQVKTYKDHKAYGKDAPKMAKKGWEVVNVTEHQVKRGCLGTLFFLTHKPKQEMVVTYRKNTA